VERHFENRVGWVLCGELRGVARADVQGRLAQRAYAAQHRFAIDASAIRNNLFLLTFLQFN
jgi:hypothetical protein